MWQRTAGASFVVDVSIGQDVPGAKTALALVDRPAPEADFHKLGLELVTWAAPGVVLDLKGRERRIFLNLKLHDIPDTVRGRRPSSKWRSLPCRCARLYSDDRGRAKCRREVGNEDHRGNALDLAR